MSETKSENLSDADLLRMAAHVVTAYVKNNPIARTDLPHVISIVHSSLSELNTPPESKEEPAKPAVAIKKSITPDYLICLEDGKKLKMLKRYLRTMYDMTPEEYRAKWNLPADYPMVAPNYAKKRSEFAKQIGLGRAGAGRRKSTTRKTTSRRTRRKAS